MTDETLLTVAENNIKGLNVEIGRLTFDIGCMKRDLDLERKAKAEDIRMYTEWLDRMIEMETTIPTGPSNAHVYEGCKKYFLEMVAK